MNQHKQPSNLKQGRGLADRLIAIANAVYGNDTRHVLDAPTGHGLAAVVRELADGPLIQTEWAAAQFRKLAVELEIAGESARELRAEAEARPHDDEPLVVYVVEGVETGVHYVASTEELAKAWIAEAEHGAYLAITALAVDRG